MSYSLLVFRATITVLSCFFAFWLPAAMAGNGLDALHDFFTDVKGFSADFEQAVFAERSTQMQTSTGHMMLQRPGQFRWDYKTPYKQLIVGDGKKIWIYDEDLEQVTVKAQDAALNNTPAQLLSSNDAVENNFKITELGAKNDINWLELESREKNVTFTTIRLGFRDKNLTVMELKDTLGNQTLLTFSKVQRNPVIDQAKFKFIPPEGVDVIGE